MIEEWVDVYHTCGGIAFSVRAASYVVGRPICKSDLRIDGKEPEGLPPIKCGSCGAVIGPSSKDILPRPHGVEMME